MMYKMHANQFEQVYRIMEASFPPDEHRSYDEQQELLDNPNYQSYVARGFEKFSAIKGFMAEWQFDDLGFIERFAVDSKYRNTGLGFKMLQEIREYLTG